MPHWQRTVRALAVAEFIAIAGFTVSMPFLPYFVQELGVTDPDSVKLWTGWLSSGQAVAMALTAPIWGSLADRFGRKIMVERAMFGGSLVFVAMGFAQTPSQLLILRIIQGTLTGTVPAATALVAAVSPARRSGSSLGLLQTGVYLGASVGPLIGGLAADTFGYRSVFWLTSASLLLAGLGVHLLVDEKSTRPENAARQRGGHLWDGILAVLASPALRTVLIVRLVVRLGRRLIDPLLPLFIQELVGPSQRLATITGAVSGFGALAAALGAFVMGRQSDRVGHRRMLILSAFGVALFLLPQSLAVNPAQLGALRVVAGFLMSGVLASAAAMIATLVPQGRQGAIYGVSTTVVAAANALAPVLAAAIGVAWGLRPIFVAGSILVALAGLLATWLLPTQRLVQLGVKIDRE